MNPNKSISKKSANEHEIQLINEAAIDSELSVLLEEYKSLIDEVISLQEFTRQNITTIYAGIGIIGAVSSFLINNNLQIAFLFFPFLF